MSTIHPTPSGTRDVLPDEMREMHAIVEAVRGVFDARGYGEVHTPALEYEQVLTRGDPAAADPAYKLFDEQGNVLVLRSDMTIPIARVVSHPLRDRRARRCASATSPTPTAPCARSAGRTARCSRRGSSSSACPRTRGRPRRSRCCARCSTPSGSPATGSGSATRRSTRRCSTPTACPRPRAPRILHELQTRDFVGLEREVEGLRLGAEATEALLRVPQRRGGPEVLDAAGAGRRRAARRRRRSCRTPWPSA